MKIDILKQRLQMYLDAEAAILAGAQSYSIGSRSLTRANLSEIQSMIDQLSDQIDSLEGYQRGFSKKAVLL